jgi:hypothetical protein
MILLCSTHPTDVFAERLANLLIVAILLLLAGVYFIFFKRKKGGFQRYVRKFLLPVTFISGFTVYFIGYEVGNSGCNLYTIFPNILESLFSTARLFILGNDLVELEPPFKHEPVFHALFSLIAALASFIFISVMVGVFFKDWLVRLKIRSTRASENHFFFGINQSSAALATDLLKSGSNRLVVFISDMAENENQHHYSLLPQKAHLIKRRSFSESVNLDKEEGLMPLLHDKKKHYHSNGHQESIFHNLRIIKNKIGVVETHLYFLTNDEDWNIEHAKLALDELQKCPEGKPIKIHVVTYSEIAEKHFANYANLSTTQIKIIIHFYASIVSRQLIADHHPVDSIELNHPAATTKFDFNALVIGFGQIGTNVLRKLIEQGQFVGSTFHATIIDEHMSTLEGRFEHLYPSLTKNYDLRFVEAKIGNTGFYKEVQSLIDNLNYIVISLGDDNLNIQTALEILETSQLKNLTKLKIFVKLEEESHWKSTLNNYKKQIAIFGEASKVFSVDNIHQSKVELMARIIHDVYNDLIFPNPGKQPFDKISRHEQLSNISAAEHLYAKIRLLGYTSFEAFLVKFSNNTEFMRSLTGEQKLILSQVEHLRWNAFHFIHGWTTIPINQIPGKTPKEKYKNRKNMEDRTHSCLIGWDDLTDLKHILGEDMQQPDVVSVENMYNFISYKSKKQ